MTSVALLNIGSEILVGRTINTNATTMSRLLRNAGYHVETTIVCHDTETEIRHWIDHLLAQHEVILMTGGLGPTKDDITKKVLQGKFGGEMVVHENTLAQIEKYLARRGRRLLESNRLQAYVPSSCEVLENKNGTAPGMTFLKEGRAVISMPGVPFEMKALMEEKVIPYLKDHFPTVEMHSRIIRTAGVPESRIAERMEEIENELPADLQVAYLPGYDGTKIELRLKGDQSRIPAIEAAQQRIANRFSKYAYALVDKTPDTLLAEWILESGHSMVTAESCTGGAIAAKMVEHSGISGVFKGGIVAYQREIKEKVLGVAPETIDEFGIVSEQVAIAMAEGARKLMGSDFAIATTGIAEASPDATAEDEIPQVWIGYADANGSHAMHFKLFRQRIQNIRVATNAAILFALRQQKDW